MGTLQAIKFWRWEWPGNKAITNSHYTILLKPPSSASYSVKCDTIAGGCHPHRLNSIVTAATMYLDPVYKEGVELLHILQYT